MSDFLWFMLMFILLPLGGAAMFIVFTNGTISGEGTMETQAIERGYAIYCPVDGEFAWLGECAETKE